jgi:5'-3' exoribonuclease 2
VQRKVIELEAQGVNLQHYHERMASKHSFDSNCITPGTEFMTRLSLALQSYITDRLSNDPAWEDLFIVFSDSSVPGEGEHKIMDFIRRQRQGPTYDPNLKHVLYGADADLIHLGLATHEASIYVLREEFRPPPQKPCSICFYRGHAATRCDGAPVDGSEDQQGYPTPRPFTPRFLLVDLPLLRHHLKQELCVAKGKTSEQGFRNVDRLIDDWIFICCFVGNDFLPHLPSLEIREGAIDTLTSLYKRVLPQMGGYINDSGHLNLARLEVLMLELGKLEDQVCRSRLQAIKAKGVTHKVSLLVKKAWFY